MSRQARGFSLLELLVSLAILAALAAMVVPVLQTSVQRQREQALQRALAEIRRGLDDYKRASDEGRIAKPLGASGYPPTLEALVEGVEDRRDPRHARIFFLRRIPADPMVAGSAAHAAASWGKRSYASDAEQPREGSDVFDVYSRSEQRGLNGVPYASW